LGGGLVKAAWFKHYREDELPVRFDRIVQSWDAANKTTKLSDFSFCTTWGVRTRLLAEGEAIIQSGSGAHSQLYFYRDAMEASLAASDWAEGVTRWWAQAVTGYGDTGIGHCIESFMQTESAY